jgi:hypothetical protein
MVHLAHMAQPDQPAVSAAPRTRNCYAPVSSISEIAPSYRPNDPRAARTPQARHEHRGVAPLAVYLSLSRKLFEFMQSYVIIELIFFAYRVGG